MNNPLRGSGLRAQLIRGGVGSLFVKLAAIPLSLAVAVLLARALGPAGYGKYSFAYALVTVLAIPTQLGLPQLVVRETAKAQANNNWSVLLGLWRWCTTMVLIASLLTAALALAGMSLLSPAFLEGREVIITLGLLLIPITALGNLRGAALRGLRHVVLGQFPEAIVRPAMFIAIFLLTIVLARPHPLSPETAMAVQVAAAGGAFVVGIALLMVNRPRELGSHLPAVTSWRPWLVSAVPLTLVSGTQIINKNVDILMLGSLASDAEAGIYRAVVTASIVIGFGLQAINVVLAPHFAKLHAESAIGRLQKVATAGSRASLVAAAVITVPFVLWGSDLLQMAFGPIYATGVTALLILLVGQLVSACCGSVGLLLSMTGHESVTLKISVLMIVGNVGLNAWLIPQFGIEGAAFSTALTISARNALLFVAVRRLIGVDPSALGLLRRKHPAGLADAG